MVFWLRRVAVEFSDPDSLSLLDLNEPCGQADSTWSPATHSALEYNVLFNRYLRVSKGGGTYRGGVGAHLTVVDDTVTFDGRGQVIMRERRYIVSSVSGAKFPGHLL